MGNFQCIRRTPRITHHNDTLDDCDVKEIEKKVAVLIPSIVNALLLHATLNDAERDALHKIKVACKEISNIVSPMQTLPNTQ